MRASVAALAAAVLLLPGAADAAAKHFINRVNVLQPFTAVGTEPFWGITISGREVTWGDPEYEDLKGTVGKPKLTRNKAVWKGTIPHHGAFTLTLSNQGDCSDGMSDFTYPLTARVETASFELNGCAATVAAYERRDREGRDEGMLR